MSRLMPPRTRAPEGSAGYDLCVIYSEGLSMPLPDDSWLRCEVSVDTTDIVRTVRQLCGVDVCEHLSSAETYEVAAYLTSDLLLRREIKEFQGRARPDPTRGAELRTRVGRVATERIRLVALLTDRAAETGSAPEGAVGVPA